MSALPDSQTQLRLILEQEASLLGRALGEVVRPGVGYCLVLFDDGNMAYLSTGERAGTIGMLGELMAKMGGDPPDISAWSDEQLDAWETRIRETRLSRQLSRRET